MKNALKSLFKGLKSSTFAFAFVPLLTTSTALGLAQPQVQNSEPQLTPTEHKVVIFDGFKTIETKSSSFEVKEILTQNSIVVDSKDKVLLPEISETETEFQSILIERATRVAISVDGGTLSVVTNAQSIAEVLAENNIALVGNDKTNMDLGAQIYNNMSISVIRVSSNTVTEAQAIPFTTTHKDDATLTKGTSKVAQEGKNGSKNITYSLVLENGAEVSRTKLSEVVIENPVGKIVLNGTKPKNVGALWPMVQDAANKYGVDAGRMYDMMMCESRGNPNSVGGGGKYFGLFQYAPGTWSGTSAGAGYAGASIFDAEAQIYATAWRISTKGWGAWPSCS